MVFAQIRMQSAPPPSTRLAASATGGVGHHFSKVIPVVTDLQALDFGEIDGQHQALRTVLVP